MNWDYLAGLVDGEGSIIIKKNGSTLFQLSNTNIDILNKTKLFLNTGIIRIDDRNPQKWKPSGSYRITNHIEVLKVLKELDGRCIIKEDKIKQTIQYIEDKDWNKRRRNDINSDLIKKLSKKGMSLRELSKLFNVGQTTIFNRLHE